jgi:hypothetical protein
VNFSAVRVVHAVSSVALAVVLFKLLVIRPNGTERPLGLVAMGLIAVAMQIVTVLCRRWRARLR